MSLRYKIQLVLFTFFGFLFLTIGGFQWYDLYQFELGLQEEAMLPKLLNTVYDMAGKWGVALVYVPFSIYSFWRAYSVFAIGKEEIEEINETLDNE